MSKLKKPPEVTRIDINANSVTFYFGWFRRPHIVDVRNIKEIRIGQDLDLWDIWTAFVYVGDIVYWFTYRTAGFNRFSLLLNFDKLFGEGWFDRATGKIVLHVDRNIMVGSIDLTGQSLRIREAETLLGGANAQSTDNGKDDRPHLSSGDGR